MTMTVSGVVVFVADESYDVNDDEQKVTNLLIEKNSCLHSGNHALNPLFYVDWPKITSARSSKHT